MDETLNPLEPVAYDATGDEVTTLLSTLDRIRGTFAWKCGGLDAAGTRQRLAPSALTLGGLLKHMALIEDHYFTHLLAGREYGPQWAGYEPDSEWRTAEEDSPAELMALWEGAVGRSRTAVAEALARDGLETLAQRPTHSGATLSLRRILADLVEEYARHTGHADLIRESVDGLVGEDPPR